MISNTGRVRHGGCFDGETKGAKIRETASGLLYSKMLKML